MLDDPGSDMPFCLCWANENWTRRWDAAEHQVLIAQRYLPEDDLEFIKSLQPFFADPRYIRVDGKPFLIVYRPQHLPDARRTAQVWRDYCRAAGIGEIHICAALTHGNLDYAQFGFDSGVEFPPHNLQCNNQAGRLSFHGPFSGYAVEYAEVATACLDRRYEHPNVFRGVFPAWDNTARTGSRAVVVLGSSPDNYQHWLAESIRRTVEDFPGGDRLVFINAWNEWAEGCHLEPDRKNGRGFLEATRAARQGKTVRGGFAPVGALPESGEPPRTLLSDLYKVARYHAYLLAGRLAAELKKHPRLRRVVRWLRNRLP